jgi:hypothetical protein
MLDTSWIMTTWMLVDIAVDASEESVSPPLELSEI